ncbi:putative armadillo-like helical protein [Helianthus anomalus]
MEIRLLAKNKPENRLKIARAGAIRPLISLISSDYEAVGGAYGGIVSNMVDKAAFVVSLVCTAEARAALVEEGGIPVLVEIVEVGSQRQKEIAVVILLQLCDESVAYRTMVAREGAIPPLVALLQSGTNRAK